MEKIQILKNYKYSYTSSTGFLLFIILLTSWLFLYNSYLTSFSKTLENSINEYSKSIDSYRSNKEFKIYSLIEINKKNLEKLESNSKITKFLDHMDYIKSTYDLDFRGFNINSSIIWTSVLFKSDDYTELNYKLAYQKLVRFIWEYRNDKNALFDLSFINKISWHDQMKFNLNFIIK